MPLLLAMVVGPGERLGALEVLDSARAYFQGPYRAVVVDDSGEIGTAIALARYPEVDYLRNWRRLGFRWLIVSLQRAYRHALTRYDFDALLKMDTDALIIGSGVDADILALLRDQPAAGMFGSRSWREREDASWKGNLERNPEMWGPTIDQAERHGYQRGESVLGGAYVLSRRCLADLGAAGYLRLRPSGERIAEDVTTSLFVRAVGHEIREFDGPDQPFALAWRGLPMAPAELLARGKKMVHSVKFSRADLDARAFFARARRRTLERSSAGGPVRTHSVALSRLTRRRRVWARCQLAGIRALLAGHRGRARRIFRMCVAIMPAEPLTWLWLAATMLPAWLIRRFVPEVTYTLRARSYLRRLRQRRT